MGNAASAEHSERLVLAKNQIGQGNGSWKGERMHFLKSSGILDILGVLYVFGSVDVFCHLLAGLMHQEDWKTHETTKNPAKVTKWTDQTPNLVNSIYINIYAMTIYYYSNFLKTGCYILQTIVSALSLGRVSCPSKRKHSLRVSRSLRSF